MKIVNLKSYPDQFQDILDNLLKEMLCLQYFYNKSYVVSCYWLLWMDTKVILSYRFKLQTNNYLPHIICCENVVDVTPLNF